MVKDILNTIRWKNLLIIGLTILVIIAPYINLSQLEPFKELLLWGVLCISVAAIGNISNDMLDVKQDAVNKKNNLFQSGHKLIGLTLSLLFAIIGIGAVLISENQNMFAIIGSSSLLLVLLYNLLLKKIALIGNMVIALLSSLVFIGISYIISTRIVYFNLGLRNIQLELLACIAFTTTLIREICKDAEDRKGDKAVGIKTLVGKLSDKKVGALIIFLFVFGTAITFFVLKMRHHDFLFPLTFYTICLGVFVFMSMVFLITQRPDKYVLATRCMKFSMLVSLMVYLFIAYFI